MGGGASAMEGVDELLSTTYMIGRAISAITFPGMYRIYDFHSSKAPKLKNQRQFSFFASDSDDEDYSVENQPDESSYSHIFSVVVGEDRIYLENPVEMNGAGWTPLHTCCMSFISVPAGLILIEESVRRGVSLDTKTIAGPGTFNSGWTALHMACAYGIGQLAEKLLEEGAKVNTTNSFGYTPMLEACHRGFQSIVEVLVKAGAILTYIPSDEESYSSPFVSAPAQTALAEASRCGFLRIVQTLLDAGAPKDQSNSLGWTSLHEACFYNRIEVVKLLMLSGANASLRTKGGALPYHLAGLQVVKVMLQEMGGQEVVPEIGDNIDMVAILRELTMPDVFFDEGNGVSICAIASFAGDERERPSSSTVGSSGHVPLLSQSTRSDSYSLLEEESKIRKELKGIDGSDAKALPFSSPTKKSTLLHSGAILGDLPSLSNDRNSRGVGASGTASTSSDINRVLDYGSASSEFPTISTGPMSPKGNSNYLLDSRADGKDKSSHYSSNTESSVGKVKQKKRDVYAPPPGFPTKFLCQLSQRPMSDPVKSIYGNVFDRSVIYRWMNKQGHICPLSGAPLSETDLKPMDDLGKEIKNWNLEKSEANISVVNTTSRNIVNNSNSVKESCGIPRTATDDLYEF